jgi:hypothetical protein
MNWWPFGTNEENVKKETVETNFETEDFDKTAEQEIKKEKINLEVAFIKINDLEKRLAEAADFIAMFSGFQSDTTKKIQIISSQKQEKDKQFEIDISTLKNTIKEHQITIEKLEDDKNKLVKMNKSFVNIFQELISTLDEDDKNNRFEKMKVKRTKDLEVINKNFTYVRKLLKDSNDKYKALVEIFSERVVEDEKMPDLLSTNISLRKVMQMKNDNKALLFSIAYMFKKYFDIKGIKL